MIGMRVSRQLAPHLEGILPQFKRRVTFLAREWGFKSLQGAPAIQSSLDRVPSAIHQRNFSRRGGRRGGAGRRGLTRAPDAASVLDPSICSDVYRDELRGQEPNRLHQFGAADRLSQHRFGTELTSNFETD